VSGATACGGGWISEPGGPRICARAAVALAVDALRLSGVRPGDRLLASGPTGPSLAVLVVAALQLDVSLALLDDGADDVSVARAVRDAAPTALVGVRTQALGAEGLAGSPLVLGSAADLLAGALAGSAPDGRACRDRCATGVDEPGPGAWADREDGIVMWTSGSTGRRKGIVRRGGAVLDNVDMTVRVMGYRSDDVLVPLLPVTHQYGMSIVVAWWLVGCGLVLGDPRRPVQAFERALRSGATVVDCAPAVLHDLLRRVVRDDLDVTRVRMWCTGGAPLSPALRRACADIVGAPPLDGYGSTELGNVALATLDDTVACGRPLPGIAARVVDAADREVATGVEGRLLVRSPWSYHRRLEAGVPMPDDGGWTDTGDLARVDEQGRLEVRGRAHAVHRNGITIYPAALEAAARDAGLPVLVVVAPDERRGSHLTAVVEHDGDVPAESWSDRLRGVLPRDEWPNRVVVLDELPRATSGKVDLAALALLVRPPGR